ncbi:Toll/interleukin-1 receptor domain-containing protein, partial [Tanacetum coccineum]
HEANFIQKIIQEISLELRFINSSIDENLVGMETRVNEVISSLETGVDDVRMIGIKGMGGAGKTTLARVVFDKISFQFEGQSFVENVREESKPSLSGLKSLQKQLLSDVLNDQGITVSGIHEGKKMIQKKMKVRKVLIVLDDVDKIEQLEALVGDRNWFKRGSRIIITTRDEQVLVAHKVCLIQNVNLLSTKEAICLFSRYAFGKEVPVPGYEELSRLVVCYAAGLPLTIRVLGSFLCEEDYKEIFSDVACLLKGWEKDDAVIALESCGFHARNGLRVLEQRSLMNISEDGYLEMHDHIEEMGMNIVRRVNPNKPERHSRLWIDEEIEDILANDLVSIMLFGLLN